MMDLEYKPTTENIELSKELDAIVTASIKWILEKDLGAMEQMTRLQFWFRKAYDQGKIDSIKTATAEELMANEHVQFLLDHISGIYTLAMDHKKRNHSIQLLCKEALEKFEVKK